jgi:predicted RNA-binding Zn-ribbon protein involved in translation (DUF1610 family)
LHPDAWRYLLPGFILGLLLTAALILAAVASPLFEVVVGAFVFVPSLVFVLPGAGMMLMGEWHRIRKGGTPDRESLCCLSCQYDLRSQFKEQRCPECGASTSHAPGPADARRATGPGLLGGTILLLFAFSPSIVYWTISYLAWTRMNWLGIALRESGVIAICCYGGLVLAAAVICRIVARGLCRRLRLARARQKTVVGVSIGLLAINVALVLLLPVCRDTMQFFMWAGLVVPSLAILLASVIALTAGAWHRKRRGEKRDTGDDSCVQCGHDLSDRTKEQLCPECGTTIDWGRLAQVLHSGLDFGRHFAWRMTWMSVLWSTLLSIVGYLLMLPFMT